MVNFSDLIFHIRQKIFENVIISLGKEYKSRWFYRAKFSPKMDQIDTKKDYILGYSA